MCKWNFSSLCEIYLKCICATLPLGLNYRLNQGKRGTVKRICCLDLLQQLETHLINTATIQTQN